MSFESILVGALVAALAKGVFLYRDNRRLRFYLSIEREAVNALCRKMGLHAIRELRPINGCMCAACQETRRLAN
jgi:hypothetical protein